MSTRFELKGYVDKKGLSQIRLVKQSGQTKRRFTTDLKVEPKYFQNKHNFWIKKSHTNYIYLNNRLSKFYEKHKDIDPRTGPLSLDQGFRLYVEHVEKSDRAPATKVKVEKSLRDMRTYFDSVKLLSKPILSLSNKAVREYFEFGLAEGKKATTMKAKIKDLQACINYLVGELEVLPENPIGSLRLRKTKQETKPKPTLDEVLELIDYEPRSSSEELAKDVWCFSLYAKGIRISDIYRLKNEDLDYSRGEILIRQKKTGDPVAIPLTEPLKEILKKYANGTEYLFDFEQIKDNHKHVDGVASRLRKGLKSICSHSNIRRIQGIHTARHSFGMLSRMANASISEIQHALGHSSPGTTENYIKQHSPESQLDLVHRVFAQIGLK